LIGQGRGVNGKRKRRKMKEKKRNTKEVRTKDFCFWLRGSL
jgi:hypothetical protein